MELAAYPSSQIDIVRHDGARIELPCFDLLAIWDPIIQGTVIGKPAKAVYDVLHEIFHGGELVSFAGYSSMVMVGLVVTRGETRPDSIRFRMTFRRGR